MGCNCPCPLPFGLEKPCTNRAQNSDGCGIMQRISRTAPAVANIDFDQ